MDPLVDKIARAVLYEGFILYPYRPSSAKNKTRFTFGRVYPESYSVAQDGAEPFTMRTECLLEAISQEAAVAVTVRFLHAMAREVKAIPYPVLHLPDAPEAGFLKAVPELKVDDTLHQTWQEAVEREIAVPAALLKDLAASPLKVAFSFPASRTIEPLHNSEQMVAGAIVRRQEAMNGEIEISAEAVDGQAFRLIVQISNYTPMPENELQNQEEIVMRTFASAHTILEAQAGDFLSLMDPPPEYAAAAAACKNMGAYPVLAGERGRRATMLSSPIILYDYPEIAPESAGELCDGLEIDEILTLRIKTMTDQEKSEMRGVDDFARKILERTESLADEHLLKMHGAMRETAAFDGEAFFNPTKKMESIRVDGVELRAGDRVRIQPKKKADAMDMALSGKIAVIEAVEQDAEDHVHLALVVEDDPGRDLGMLRQPGHRFFYGIDEVALLREGE